MSKSVKTKVIPKAQVLGEWQLCPKCHGSGNVYVHENFGMSVTVGHSTCDVCNGFKIIQRPVITP